MEVPKSSMKLTSQSNYSLVILSHVNCIASFFFDWNSIAGAVVHSSFEFILLYFCINKWSCLEVCYPEFFE